MKKLFLITLMMAGSVFYLCAAGQAAEPEANSKGGTRKVVETKYLIGKVDAVSLEDPAKGTKSEVVVVDEKGNGESFRVRSTTRIYDVKSVSISLDKIKKNDKVTVKYITTREGVNETLSIRIRGK